ncbi:hypothetical protein [Nocardia cyriacigeorgica]|jgi:hypothetical protein|uniref:hypothetical protein n=1 Tax=Nocardia cyriacigeorgica TaxID=135487 RepID=UPI0013D0425C|nr:hypothetical protein [Nocardia cyriacigeorgica]MBF6436881.1 hypothetical protein [Nocardia cyriacigeorgica]MBF6452448.1 hypothetical protein [Nocardia cyriacigeorgica]MBF6481095.1 hypothetical protein [Nocardia cyriacigeorgica]MBF6549617.1 hypothetical protein [Nocardia cyriacigeorgica]NEW26305.1 hypothetical protein [Nocardia cyriacigeorgica]
MVPEWCEFFTADEYAKFAEYVDSALGSFGAEGQDVDNGWVSVASGEPDPELYELDLTELAGECRANPIEDWPVLCFSAVDRFVVCAPQREWLTQATFAEVEDLLEPWLADAPELTFEAPPDHPDQPFSTRLDDGRYLHFVATVPELGDIPEIPAFVPNSAIGSWNVPVDDLVRWAATRA